MELHIMKFPVASVTSPLKQNILLVTLFSDVPNLCSSHNEKEYVSLPNRTMDKIFFNAYWSVNI
jgi:hypothetical protein